MNKYIVLSAVLTATLVFSWGCEQNKASDAKPTPPPAAVAAQQPAATPAAIEPNKVEVKPEPVKIEQPVSAEPNVPAAPGAEIPVQAEKPAEPNTQQAATPKPAPAEADSVKAQPTPSPASTTATQLCDKCTEFLQKYVSQDGMVDYKKLKSKKMELAKLLDQFKTLDRNEYNSWSNDDKLAFWINSLQSRTYQDNSGQLPDRIKPYASAYLAAEQHQAYRWNMGCAQVYRNGRRVHAAGN